jgi:hypothetical protein
MKTTDLRVGLYFGLPIIALIFPWFSYDVATGLVTIQFSIEAAIASVGTAGAAVAGIYAKWGKR